ncbi:hypothetical protein [Flavobacterium sp.]|uniref:hypothetical protein n=1 Tax=Flavobacterium sp. TaxID=239 RepID=UPI002633EF57|nr:hypothetical protein [Flavobacterium sp.]
MISLLKTIVSKLGGVDTSEKNHVDTFTENRILNVPGEQIASIENGGIWVDFQELSDYHFMNIIVIGKKKYKTFEGCELVFSSNSSELKLISDSKEIASDFSNVSNRWITQVDFDITNINIDMIINKEANQVHFNFKKDSETFEIIK